MRLLARLFSVLVLCTFAIAAHALESPAASPILTVSGNISEVNQGDIAVFDREMLERLDWVEIETHTSFTTGVQVFSGPTLASLLETLGVSEGTLRATAINDYTVEIPVGHATTHEVLLAMEHNGTPMRIRDKGPIWVVYPMTPEQAADQLFDGEMIWQLNRIEVAN